MISSDTLNLLLAFREERDWKQFHSTKNLAVALSVEVSELLDHFIWSQDEQIKTILSDKRESINNEIADIAIVLSYLVNDLGIDLDSAVRNKIALNALKYPLEKSRGSNKKYTEL